MWSETIGYRDYRQPYLKRFFRAVAKAIPLIGKEDLLDLGCGAGEVMLGFAPFVATLTGLDLEQPMLEETARRAHALGRAIRLIQAKVEDAPPDLGRFDLITIGRAHWFMHNPASIARLDQWLRPDGHILVCQPVEDPDGAEWRKVYATTRCKWAKGSHRTLTQLSIEQFFHGTKFVAEKRVTSHGQSRLELKQLIFRALGTPSTTFAVLGADTDRMIAALRDALAPYFRDGWIMERHITLGRIYRRPKDS